MPAIVSEYLLGIEYIGIEAYVSKFRVPELGINYMSKPRYQSLEPLYI